MEEGEGETESKKKDDGQAESTEENPVMNKTKRAVSKIQKYINSSPFLKKYSHLLVDGSLELFITVALVIYGVNYYIGAVGNRIIANSWLRNVRSLIFNNFAIIGTDNEELKDKSMICFEDVD